MKCPQSALSGIAPLVLAGVLAVSFAIGEGGLAETGALAPGGASTAQEPALHRAIGLLQYVLGDYGAAVDETGFIINEAEFLEQHRILDEVAEILEDAAQEGLPARRSSAVALMRNLEILRDAASERQPPTVVSDATRNLRDAIVDAYGLQMAPNRPPQLERGAALYRESCSPCHGLDGRARTAVALRLDPPPTDFAAPRLRETLSPYQVFNVVTFGIPGTSMPSYEALSEEERWDVAFHVLAMRHEPPHRGREPVHEVPMAMNDGPSLLELARYTDAELGDWFLSQGVQNENRERSVARARHLEYRRSGSP